MKKIKTLCAIAALVLFIACYNPNSSTSQEPSEETTMTEHSEETQGGEHKVKAGETAPLHTDTTATTGEAMHKDSAIHKDSTAHK